ncbi:MAG: 16S rRNA (cytidine(1402)-2'-O)-methyltransferase [Actinomycetes bacterium]|jgi:16S rRNA (cytidine1402-2'-O)-methyltransferase
MSVLILAAIPLGNSGDASTRLKECIESVEYVAAEDSRRFARLCQDLGIRHQAKVISFFEGNEIERLAGLIEILETGKDLLVVSDAGMPGISDPGYRLVREAVSRKIQIQVLPGPSAVTTALLLSGLPSDTFCFDGFPPRSSGTRLAWYEARAEEERTIIIFEAPHRLVESLQDMEKAFGADRSIAVCREMTKTYEEVARGPISEILDWALSKEILGELTIVIEGFNPESRTFTDDELVSKVLVRESAGEARKEAIAAVAKEVGVAKRTVFDAMVSQKTNNKKG